MTFKYTLDQCDVVDREALSEFREKRCEWLAWLMSDEHHAISTTIPSVVWNEMRFRILAYIAEKEAKSGLHNPLLTEALIEGHFAVQILAIRRLVDKRSDVISVRRLLEDIGKNIHLFRRESFVSFDGLPYDYEAVERRVIAEHMNQGRFWGAKSEPNAHRASQRAHELFDHLAGISAANRNRKDALPKTRVDTLFDWLNASKADELVVWSHKFLAHAADGTSRQRIDLASLAPNLDKIDVVLRSLVQISEAITAYLLFEGGYGEVVPTPQFDQFERLRSPLLSSGEHLDLRNYWDQLATERNGYLNQVLETLVGTKSS